jgi:hypothetical protein
VLSKRSSVLAFIALLSICAIGQSARAVVIVPGDGSGNTSAPASAFNAGTFDFSTFNLWNNVGSLNGATAIYLGNQTVLTAAHVGAGNVLLNNGQTLTPTGVSMHLTDPMNGNPADLLLFKVSQSPALPTIAVPLATPTVGQNLLMSGNGWDRNANLNFWNVNGTTWTDQGTNATGANRAGYNTLSPPFTASPSQHIRWGTNIVSFPAALDSGDNTRLFVSDFTSGAGATPYEAQAVDKDSGGSVFVNIAGAWQLAGVINGVGVDVNRPNATFSAVFGEQTDMADLSEYRDQINAFVPEPTTMMIGALIPTMLLLRRRGQLR